MSGDRPPLLVVDAANVVGSVPDGWWRDRAAATERLRNTLAAVARTGLPDTGLRGSPDAGAVSLAGPLDVVLVVEGAARRVAGIPGVRVVPATASGDDAIVDLVRDECADRQCVVVTADRELRSRVTELGADVIGPRSVRRIRE